MQNPMLSFFPTEPPAGAPADRPAAHVFDGCRQRQRIIPYFLLLVCLAGSVGPFPARASIADAPVRKLLLAHPWCMEARSKGDSASERAEFQPDGFMVVTGTTAPGASGVPQTERFRWRLDDGQLLLSPDNGRSWANIPFTAQPGATKGPLISIAGDSYRPCR